MSDPNARAFRFAAFAVIAMAAAVIAMSVYYTFILASRDFCSTVMGAKAVTGGGSAEAVTAVCANLMTIQLKAVAVNSYINSATIAVCLVALVILVIAGGRFAFKAGKDGFEGSMSRDRNEAADRVAAAAEIEADNIAATEEPKP